MKPDISHIAKIRSMFAKMQTREDLLDVLNEAKKIMLGDDVSPFKISALTYFSNPKRTESEYTRFEIEKKSGALRQLHAPKEGLKKFQRVVSFVLQCVYETHDAATGFVWDKSIVDNARKHIGQRYIYNIDLKDFFESIDQARVWKCLQLPPFNLNFKTTAEVEVVNWNEQVQSKKKLLLPPSARAIKSGKYRRVTFNGSNYYMADMDSVRPFISRAIERNEKLRFEREPFTIIQYASLKGIRELIPYVQFNKLRRPYVELFLENGASLPIYFAPKAALTVGKDTYLKSIASDLEVAVYKNQFGEEKVYFERISIAEDLIHPEFFKDFWMVNRDPDFTRVNIANLIAGLCCKSMEVERINEMGVWEKVTRNVLPQGAPTSPVLTNIVCQKLDFLLTGVAKRFGLRYSRYADDITFSSMHNVYQPDGEFLKELHRILAVQNFHIKESKTRLQKDGYRKEVTGLLVNENVNVQHRYIKQLRMWLYYWETYGYERAYGIFLQQYVADSSSLKSGVPNMAKVIAGKLEYLKMVKGANNPLYMKLAMRYSKLVTIAHEKVNRKEYLQDLVEMVFDKGLTEAMSHYKPITG
jgi:retron-type reverse transcriptase